MAMKRYSKVVWPGFSSGPQTRHETKIGRNEPCPCGSGKKYKICHQQEGAAFLKKLGRAEDKRHKKELRRHLKEQGAPWYKRLFFLR